MSACVGMTSRVCGSTRWFIQSDVSVCVCVYVYVSQGMRARVPQVVCVAALFCVSQAPRQPTLQVSTVQQSSAQHNTT